MCASSESGCAFVYFTIQYCIEYSIFISSPECPEASINSSSDIAGTVKKCQELEAQRKDEERQEEEVTKEPKRFTIQEMARGVFFI